MHGSHRSPKASIGIDTKPTDNLEVHAVIGWLFSIKCSKFTGMSRAYPWNLLNILCMCVTFIYS